MTIKNYVGNKLYNIVDFVNNIFFNIDANGTQSNGFVHKVYLYTDYLSLYIAKKTFTSEQIDKLLGRPFGEKRHLKSKGVIVNPLKNLAPIEKNTQEDHELIKEIALINSAHDRHKKIRELQNVNM